MKKLLLTLGLLLVVNQSNCGLFDDSMAFLKKTANSLFDKGKKYLSENSDKILGMVKEKGAELLQKGTEMAKEKVANQNRTTLVKQAQESIAKKREALKSSIYEKYGKGTPTQ